MSIATEIRRRETARQIARAMASAGVSKAELARKLGKSPSAVTSWLSGNHNFTSDLLAEISSVLGTQITGVGAQITGVGTLEDAGVGSVEGTMDLVDGYRGVSKEAGLEDPAGACLIDAICLQPKEYEVLSRKAGSVGVSLRSYVELILGREARTVEMSEESRTKSFLSNCLGVWSGSDFDSVEEEIYRTRTVRKVEEL